MILKDCGICKIFDEDARFLMKARVKSVKANITLYFDDNMHLEPGAERMLWIDFFDSQLGYIKTLSKIILRKNTDPKITEQWAAGCEIVKVLETIQRQKDLRVKLEKNVEFSSVMHGQFTGSIHNISVGGILLFTEASLNVHEEISFHYCFLKKEQKMTAAILREQPIEDTYHVYGCRFIHLTNSAEKDIRQFVFRHQLKMV